MINGQITSKGKRVDYGKTDAAIRPIGLPDWAAALLRATEGRPDTQRPRRRVHHPQRHLALPHQHPRPTASHPLARGLRRPHGSPGRHAPILPPTEIDQVYDAEAAKNQLGHTSTAVTERHYINRKLVVPDYRAATERLAPGSGASDGAGL